MRNSRYEKSRGQLTCEIGKDPAILPKRCGHLDRAAGWPELVCGGLLDGGHRTPTHRATHVSSHTSRCQQGISAGACTHLVEASPRVLSPAETEEPHARTPSTQTLAPYTLTLNTARKRSTKQPNGHTWLYSGAQACTEKLTARNTDLCAHWGSFQMLKQGDPCGHSDNMASSSQHD